MNKVLALLDGVGGPEVVVIAILALLMFGSKRLPDLARSFGRAIREFKRATRDVEDNIREAMREEPAPRVRPPARQIPSRVNPAPPAKKDEAPKPVAEPKPVPEPKPVAEPKPAQSFPRQDGDAF